MANGSPIPALQHLLVMLERQLAILASDDPMRAALEAALLAVQQRLSEG